jgi:Flp pilus assembly protein TadD
MQPDTPAALTGKAIVQRALGHPEDAVPSFARVAAQRPHNGPAQFNLAGASLDAAQRAPRGAPAESLFAISEHAFSACIDANYQQPDALERRAHLRLRRGAVRDAAADARRLLTISTHVYAGRVLLARAALVQKNPAEAVRVLTPDENPPASADALLLLGKAYSQLGRHADAAAALQRAHDLAPEDWTTAMNLGVALSESGDLPNAERLLRSLLAKRPGDPVALQNLAAVLQRRGQLAEAKRLLQQAGAGP